MTIDSFCQLRRLRLKSWNAAGTGRLRHVSSGTGLRERKAQRTREQLVAVALRLFSERGYDAVTVDDIADDALMSARTVFRYFGSKDEILFAEDDQLLAVVLDAARSSTAPRAFDIALDAVVALAEQISGRHAELCSRQRVIDAVPALQARTRVKLERWEQELADVLVDRCRPMKLREARLLAQAALLCWRWAYTEWTGHRRPKSLAALVQDAATMLSACA
jgi:AcrR family transcriptional regulator